ncbi:MAG: 23S rRNA (pseudouridine(1915)-N(3))-methyltransferase RlmH [Bacilli bacterium]|nr:23S rRNA (pseudouridine(1915)-N(3))-methyltransferase RlmH [Bacilli bacterium]
MIKLVCVGKIKEKFIREGIDEYTKRLSAYENFSLVEVKEVNSKTALENMKAEAEFILSKINDDEFVVTLEIEGKMLDSVELAEMIETKKTYGTSKITFVIGGSNGLHESVKKRSNYALSFSKFTFPHQLMRLIFVEQLYRAETIINHQEYHK